MKQIVACLTLGLSAALVTGETPAQQYPTKPIRVIVAASAGGPSDFIVRTIGQKLTESWGATIVVDNRGGAGGNIGVELAAKATPDGYTLVLVGLHYVVSPSLYASVGYDPSKDFAPVTLAAVSPVIIAAHPSFPARDVRGLVRLAKESPVSYGSPGSGTAAHVAAELLNSVAGIRLEQIPYKGAAPAVADLLGGQIKLTFTASPPITPHVRSGKLRAIAVTTLKRSAALPEVPTVAESDFPGFFVDNIYGFLAPAGTPSAIVEKLNREIVRIVNQPDVRERLTSQGYDPVGDTAGEFDRYLRAELAKWAKVVKASGARPN